MKTTLNGLCLFLAIAMLGCGPQKQPVAGGPMGGTPAAGPMGGSLTIPGVEDLKKVGEDLQKKGEDLKKQGEEAVAKATEEIKKFEGGQDALNAVTDFFTKANETLGGIKDEATAKAAEPTLMKLTEEADAVKATLAKLPAEAKTIVSGAVESGVSGLKALAEKLKEVPAVEPIVKPHLDALIAKVESWKS